MNSVRTFRSRWCLKILLFVALSAILGYWTEGLRRNILVSSSDIDLASVLFSGAETLLEFGNGQSGEHLREIILNSD